MGYLIKAIPTEIVNAKVTLTSANLLTPGYIYNIPEYPAVPNYFWNVLYMCGQIVNGTTPYITGGQIHIQNENAPQPQFRFDSMLMTNLPGFFTKGVTIVPGRNYLENDQLQIHNDATGFIGGDTDLNIYIGATLIKY